MKSVPFAPLDPALYRETVRRALAEDLGWGDVTTEATVGPEKRARGVILAKAPCVIAFPDCFTKLGGNQYINSAAMGRWDDFLLKECVPFVEQKFGCGGAADPPQPVRGKVLFQGKPAPGAVVTLVSRSGGAPAKQYSGVVGQDGTFKISGRGTFDGAPAGRYGVTIFDPSAEKQVDGQNAGPDLLKGKYADSKTTPLKVEVKPGENELEPFHLK